MDFASFVPHGEKKLGIAGIYVEKTQIADLFHSFAVALNVSHFCGEFKLVLLPLAGSLSLLGQCLKRFPGSPIQR